MSVHRVNLQDSPRADRILRDYGMADTPHRPPRAVQFPDPIRVVSVFPGDEAHLVSQTFRVSFQLFRHLENLYRLGGLVVRLSWRGCQLGPLGLWAINQAVRAPALRQGGHNVVRNFVRENGSYVGTREDFFALLDYLEIRPLPLSSRPAKPSRVRS
ncbi:MAG: hypothetical protein PHE83_09465 [Opitutaceae bacterium]|nr:hypothetical protein [Opitutaceae bacterium]